VSDAKLRRAGQNVEDRREICLEEEVARLRRSGMSTPEIAREMGVDESWVESLVSMSAEEGSSVAEDRG
jgi:transposase